MSATVDIVTENKEQAIAIPIQSLTSPRKKPMEDEGKKPAFNVEVNTKERWSNNKNEKNKGKNVVFVVKGNTVEQRFVETGIVGDRDYEILSGLQEGEEIVTGSFVAISRELYDGAKVKVKDKSNNKERSSRKRG